MILHQLWLENFRSYASLHLKFDEGLSAFVGANGRGKTNLIEAVAYLATLKSFRGSPTENLLRKGCESAIIRAEGVREGRDVLLEVQISKGRSKVQINRQKVKRSRDLLGALRVSVFSPDDLSVIKGGPSFRRDFLDDVIVSLDPKVDSLFQQYDRSLKQRNALLKQIRKRFDDTASTTLDVWDTRLAELGEKVVDKRIQTVEKLLPLIQESYESLARSSSTVEASYQRSWEGESLQSALLESRDQDIRRASTSLGPHRDNLSFMLNGLSSRRESSQGEQRTLSLSCRVAAHRLITFQIGEPPLLLLDDVLSELDEQRSTALLQALPKGQTFLSSACALPEEVNPDALFQFEKDGLERIDE